MNPLDLDSLAISWTATKLTKKELKGYLGVDDEGVHCGLKSLHFGWVKPIALVALCASTSRPVMVCFVPS